MSASWTVYLQSTTILVAVVGTLLVVQRLSMRRFGRRPPTDGSPDETPAEAMGGVLSRLSGEDFAAAFDPSSERFDADLRADMTDDGAFVIERLRERGFDVVRMGERP